MDHPVSTSYLKLDSLKESCTSRRFKVPRKKICPWCWNVASIYKGQLGIQWVSHHRPFVCPDRISPVQSNATQALKLARDTQMRLSGLLIDAQERERSSLAAELHDDFSQCVALLLYLYLACETPKKHYPPHRNDVDQKLEKLKETVRELGDDLHAVSHRLHSATLNKLGLVSGLRAMCREFSDGQGIQIAFLSEDVPAHISRDVALCLFRIASRKLSRT